MRLGLGRVVLPCAVQALGADAQVNARLVDRVQRVVEGEVAVLEKLQLLVELVEGLLVREVLAHFSTSSTRAPSRPLPRWMRTARPLAVSPADRITAPDSASCVRL